MEYRPSVVMSIYHLKFVASAEKITFIITTTAMTAAVSSTAVPP